MLSFCPRIMQEVSKGGEVRVSAVSRPEGMLSMPEATIRFELLF